MEEIEKGKETLYIPAGLKVNKEFYNGFGRNELRQALIGIGGFAAINASVSLVLLGRIEIFVVAMFFGIFASVMCVQKDSTNLSVIDMITNLFRYLKSQKKYHYKTIDEWSWKK